MLNTTFKKLLSNTLKISALVLSSALLFSTTSAEIIYQQDFEKGGQFEKNGGSYFWDGLKNSLNYPTITDAPQRSGKAGNFYLHHKGTDTTLGGNYRTEAYLTDGKGAFDFGKEYWITMDYLYKDWETDPGSEMAPFQVHSKPGSWDTECRLHNAHSTAPFLMRTMAGKAGFLTYGGKTMWSETIQKNQWLNILVHFKISYGSDGFVEAWKDGVKLGRVNGPNSPKNDNCGNPMKSPFFKMGIYKSSWKYATTVATSRELWIDNFKLGAGSENPFDGTPPPKDTQAPSTPQNLKASGITKTSINLNWVASSDNIGVTAYEVNYNGKVKGVSSNSTTLTGLTPNVNYSIKVRAKDTAGNVSAFSAPETAVTDADTPTPLVLVANAGKDKILRCGTTFRTVGNADNEKTATSDNATYHWTTSNGHIRAGTNTKVAEVDKAGTYMLTVSKTGGATVTDSAVITQETGCTTEPDDSNETTEPVQDKTEEDIGAGSFPIGLLMFGFLAFLRRKVNEATFKKLL